MCYEKKKKTKKRHLVVTARGEDAAGPRSVRALKQVQGRGRRKIRCDYRRGRRRVGIH